MADVFATSASDANSAAADLYYYLGPHMLLSQRTLASPFATAARVLGKIYQSDADADLCDGRQLATEVAEGLCTQAWPALFDSIKLSGEARLVDLKDRALYASCILAADHSPARHIVKLLPGAMSHKDTLPALSSTFIPLDWMNTLPSNTIHKFR